MTRGRHLTISAVALTAFAALTACGSDASSTAGTPGTAGTARTTDAGDTTVDTTGASDAFGPPTTIAAPATTGRGWVEGEPDWSSAGSASDGGAESADTASPAEATGDEYAPAATEGAETAETMAAAGSPDAEQAPLRAGSVDDNADYAGYLEYLARYDALGFVSRPFDPSGRIVVTVVGSDGLPVDGMAVTFTDGGESVAVLQTTADGQVVFLPAGHGDVAASYRVTAGDAAGEAAPDSALSLTVSTPGGAEAGMPVDILFLLDVTGSMGDEIAQLKATIGDVADRLRALPQSPDIRFGMTLFHDEGDLFVTSTFDFTSDIDEFHAALEPVVAEGGGDTPEAVDEGFAAALTDPSWRDPASTVQLIFLVGDAAPQEARQVDQPFTASILEAAARGITVHAVAASQTDDPAEHAFRAIAQGTGGRFVFLAYGAAGTATGPSTDIADTDYEELSLNDLVVRLVGEELAALTGSTFELPPETTVPPTNPPGQ